MDHDFRTLQWLMTCLIGHKPAGMNIMEADIDTDSLICLAGRNDVAPLLYGRLASLQTFPAEAEPRLRNAYLFALRNNLRQRAEILRLIRLLRKEGIDAMPLKGVVASDLLFGDTGLYPGGDIDILVRPCDLDRASAVLLRDGYGPPADRSEADLRSDSYHLVLTRDSHVVELHWRLTARYCDIPPEFWWEDAVTVDYEGTSIIQPSPEKYLLYAVFRLFAKGFRPLKFFVLASGLIEKYSDSIDWERLISLSEMYRIGRVLRFTVSLVFDYSRRPVQGAQDRVSVLGHRFFRRLVLSGFVSGRVSVHLRMLFYAFLLDSPSDIIKVLVRRIFPSPGELRLRYGLPPRSRRVFLYYIANPLLLVMRRY